MSESIYRGNFFKDSFVGKAIVTSVATLALASCGNSQSSNTDEVFPTSTSSSSPEVNTYEDIGIDSDNKIFENVDTSDETSKEVTGWTRNKAIKVAQDTQTYNEALVKAYKDQDPWVSEEPILPDWVNINEVRDTHREMFQKILEKDTTYIQDLVTKLRITPQELVSTLNRMSVKDKDGKTELQYQLALADKIRDNLDQYDAPTKGPLQKIHAMYVIREAENRALTYYSITTILELAKNGRLEFNAIDDPCDISDIPNLSLPEDYIWPVPKDAGYVQVVTTLPSDESARRFDQQFLGFSNIVEPLPGLEADESSCSKELKNALDRINVEIRLKGSWNDVDIQNELAQSLGVPFLPQNSDLTTLSNATWLEPSW